MTDEIDKIQIVARELSENVLPVLEVREGSGRLQQVGSAWVFRHGQRASLVTADHVVCGPQRKLVQLAKGQTVTWPKPYTVVRARDTSVPDPDLAYASGELDADRPHGIQPRNIIPNFEAEPGASLLAMGYPGSRADVLQHDRSLRNELHYLLVQAAPHADYESVGLEPDRHIVVRYDPEQLRDSDGNLKRGALPKGMSGGLLCVPLATRPEPPAEYVIGVVGVLVKYFKSPHHLLAAVRIDPLLDAMAPYREASERTHDPAESHGGCAE